MTIVNDTRLADTNALLRKLGRESANSDVAKPKMGLAVVNAMYEGIVTVDDGAKLYDTYLDGRTKVLSATPLGSGSGDNGGYKANVSKVTQLLKATALKAADIDFRDVLARATVLRDEQAKAGEKVKPVFDSYVDLARAQLKAPEAALDDETIVGIVRKPERAEKEDLDKLIDLYKRAHKMAEQIAIAPMTEAVTSLGNAIAELGGEVPALTEEEKKEAADAAAVAAFLARTGYRVSAGGKIVPLNG